MNEEFSALLQSLKSHVEENDGEVVYWGDTISQRDVVGVRAPAPAAAVKSATTIMPRTDLSNAARLEKYRTETVGDCHRCPLGETRHKLVFGVGNPDANVMFIGEGPGFDEDLKGEPFVGKAGQLLDKIMASIGLNRTNSYIANVVKCHPMIDPARRDQRGNDRPPQPDEMDKCLPFLREQIGIIKPKIIVTLGAVSTKALLNRSQGISALRGSIYAVSFPEAGEIKILPTFHPAALLRDETLKRAVWEDMKRLRNELDV